MPTPQDLIEDDPAREAALDELTDTFGEDAITDDLRNVVNERIMYLYDNRDELHDLADQPDSDDIEAALGVGD